MTFAPRVRAEEAVPDPFQVVREPTRNTGDSAGHAPGADTAQPQVSLGASLRSPQLPGPRAQASSSCTGRRGMCRSTGDSAAEVGSSLGRPRLLDSGRRQPTMTARRTSPPPPSSENPAPHDPRHDPGQEVTQHRRAPDLLLLGRAGPFAGEGRGRHGFRPQLCVRVGHGLDEALRPARCPHAVEARFRADLQDRPPRVDVAQ